MSEIIICVALKSESNGFVEEAIKGKSNIHLVYTNVGKINAAYFLTKKIKELEMIGLKTSLVINVGTAGGKNVKKGELVYCNKFIQRDFDHTPLGFKKGVNNSFCENEHISSSPMCNIIVEHKDFGLGLDNIICGTGDNFETLKNNHSLQIQELEVSVQDMEAYGLALVCEYEKIDFIAIKYVSDEMFTNVSQAHEFESSLNKAPEVLGSELKRVLMLLD